MIEQQDKATIVVFSGDLDKVIACFNIALAAAAMGMPVKMYFTFWGLNVLKKDRGRIKSKGLMRNMLNMLNRGGVSRLHLSKFHMAGMGTWMMKKMMKEKNVLGIPEAIKLAKEMGVEFYACTTTLGIMAISKEDLIPGVDGYVGAATFVQEARESKLALFI